MHPLLVLQVQSHKLIWFGENKTLVFIVGGVFFDIGVSIA